MPGNLFENNDFLIDTLNAIPFPVMVVDNDVRILFWNSAALRLLGNEDVFQKRSGEALHCIHDKTPDQQCGQTEACKTCIVRNSVYEAFNGKMVYRKKTVMTLRSGDTGTEVPLLVTASPFRYDNRPLSLLILENIREIMQLGSFLPICANCKKIRTEANRWEPVEHYIKTRIVDVDFTHGMCPDCLKEFYPDIIAREK